MNSAPTVWAGSFERRRITKTFWMNCSSTQTLQYSSDSFRKWETPSNDWETFNTKRKFKKRQKNGACYRISIYH